MRSRSLSQILVEYPLPLLYNERGWKIFVPNLALHISSSGGWYYWLYGARSTSLRSATIIQELKNAIRNIRSALK